MKTNKSIILRTLAAGAMLAASATAVNAVPCNVPAAAYPTIQSAASDGTCDVINVAPGAYHENVNVTHSATINGAQAGNTYAHRSAGGESVVDGAGPGVATPTFTINATDVTIDGFTIKNSLTLFAASGVEIKGTGSEATILNNIFDGITTADTGGNGAAQAVYLSSGGPDNVNIEGNEMKNVHANRSTKGVLIGDNGGTNPSQNVQIKGNSIHNITSDTRGAYGVAVGRVTNVSGLKIDNNSISNLTGGGWVHAIGLEGDTPGAMINDNDISLLSAPTADIAGVLFESNPSFATVSAHTNNFNLPATQFGIAVNPALSGGSVDASCNWWNSASGPTTATNPTGTGAQVSSGVNYRPWLISPAPGSSCYGGNVPATAAQCKSGGWMTQTRSDGSTFKNQGDCIQYTNTGK